MIRRMPESSVKVHSTSIISAASNNALQPGHVKCRLLPDSEEIRELGKTLKTKMGSNDILFVIEEEYREDEAQPLHNTADAIGDMMQAGNFKMKVQVPLSSKLAITKLSLSLGHEGTFPISGFPRSLWEDRRATLSEFTEASTI